MRVALTVAAIVALAAVGTPATAEAQARGTLQASATVVDTRPAFAALEAARTAIQAPMQSRAESRNQSQPSVVTVARSSQAVVVTINYARN